MRGIFGNNATLEESSYKFGADSSIGRGYDGMLPNLNVSKRE